MPHIRVLCTGDLHLGRVSSKCTQDGEEIGDYSVRRAWQRVVDCAIAREVSLVLLSGDIADDKSNPYEAMGSFEAGMARLAAKQIAVFCVAGNHDAQVLRRLVKSSKYPVHLLGHDGGWEQVEWPEHAPQVSLIGWSHSDSNVRELPLAELAPSSHSDRPLLALAHTDYHNTTDKYAASNVEALRRISGVDCWLLGHIHAPEILAGAPLILNPGSPQALDPGEPGIHGPWLLELAGNQVVQVEQIPLSSVAYDAIVVSMDGFTEADELIAWLQPELDRLRERYRSGEYQPRLSIRVTLTGRTDALNVLYENRENLLNAQPRLYPDNMYFDGIELSGVRPAYDLRQLRREHGGPVAVLAGILLALEEGETNEQAAAFLHGAGEVVRQTLNMPAFNLAEVKDDVPAAAEVLATECRRLLDVLLRQMEAAP